MARRACGPPTSRPSATRVAPCPPRAAASEHRRRIAVGRRRVPGTLSAVARRQTGTATGGAPRRLRRARAPTTPSACGGSRQGWRRDAAGARGRALDPLLRPRRRSVGAASASAASPGSRATSGAATPRAGRRPRGSAPAGWRSTAGDALVHTSVSGYARLYWIEDRGATYFASRVDPLVRAWPRPLSVDWDAWAATIILRYPSATGPRSPRSGGSAPTPRSAADRALAVERPAWPWAEIEPRLSLDAGADAWVAALREVIAPLEGEVLCPLSGGRDSRIVLCAVPAGRRCTAITVDDDEGGRFEEDHAAPVARALGVAHEELRGRAEDYPRDWDERARRVEYQFVDHAWLVPLAQRIAGAPRAGARRRGDRRHASRPATRFYTAATPRHQPPAGRQRGAVRDRAPLRPRAAGAREPACGTPLRRARPRAVHGRDAGGSRAIRPRASSASTGPARCAGPRATRAGCSAQRRG